MRYGPSYTQNTYSIWVCLVPPKWVVVILAGQSLGHPAHLPGLPRRGGLPSHGASAEEFGGGDPASQTVPGWEAEVSSLRVETGKGLAFRRPTHPDPS